MSSPENVAAQTSVGPKLKVFVSYSRKDGAFADELVSGLGLCGFEAYLDKDDIAPGEPWQDRLGHLIRDADTVVFVLSPSSIASEHCEWEVAETVRLSKRLLPIVWQTVPDNEVPEQLQRLNYIFFTEGHSFTKSLGELASALRTDLEWIRQHTRFGELAANWEEKGRPESLLLLSGEIDDAKAWLVNRPKDAPPITVQQQTFIDASILADTSRRNRELEEARKLAEAEKKAADEQRKVASRTRVGFIVASALALLALATAVFGFIKAREAERALNLAQAQRDRAEHTLDVATDAANSLIYDIAQKFRYAAGVPATLVKDILDRALELQDQLIGSGEANLSLLATQSGALTQASITLLTLGDSNGALAAAKKAQSIGQSLVVTEPDNAVLQNNLAFTDNQVGSALAAQGKLDEALVAYRDDLAISKAVGAKDASNTEWQRGILFSDAKIGGLLMRQGKFDEAFTAYRDSLAIAKALAAQYAGSNPERQRDVAFSYQGMGDVLLRQDKPEEALAAYRDELTIAKALAALDASNTEWQRDVAVGDKGIGDVLMRQGKSDEAFTAYRDSLAIAKALVAKDGSNTFWQRDLSVGDKGIGDVLKRQGKFDEAFTAYRDSLAIAKALVAKDGSNADWQGDLSATADAIGSLAYLLVQAHDFAKALEAADEAISLTPDEIWLYANRAHALMFLGRLDEARALYLQYRGTKNVLDEESWETDILEDFADLRKAGLMNPLMDEIEKQFTTAG